MGCVGVLLGATAARDRSLNIHFVTSHSLFNLIDKLIMITRIEMVTWYEDVSLGGEAGDRALLPPRSSTGKGDEERLPGEGEGGFSGHM